MSTWDPAGGADDISAPGTPQQAEPQQPPGPPFPGEDPESPDLHPETGLWSGEVGEDAYEETHYTAEDWPDWEEAESEEAESYAPGSEGEYEGSYLEGRDYAPYTGEPWRYPAHTRAPGVYGTGNGGRRLAKGRPSGPWPGLVMVTSVAVIVAAVALGVTSANRDALTSSSSPSVAASAGGKPNVATSAGGNKARPGGAGPSTAGGKTTGSTRPSGTKTSRSSTSATGPQTSASARPTRKTRARVLAKNLVISPLAKRQLVETWIATDPGGLGLTAKDVAGTVRGEVYYGYDASIATYFALAAFQPSPLVLKKASTARGQAELRAFQDTQYVFSLQTGSTWTELGIVTTGSCPGEWVPTAVLAVWGMCGLKPPAT